MAPMSSRSISPANRVDVNPVFQNPISTETIKYASPPRTPRRKKDPPTSYPKSARLAAATGIPLADDMHGYERDWTTDDDTEDPHDLTYHHTHVLRASMVDSMVMALDQFSNPAIESRYCEEDEKAYRGRGHTISSSVSSDSDLRGIHSKSAKTQVQRLAKRSSTMYVGSPRKLSSIFGGDEDSARVRVHEVQVTTPSAKRQHSRTTSHQQRGKASANSIDVSHLHHMQGRLGTAGNRKSQSFDFGTRAQVQEAAHHDGALHTPAVYTASDAQEAPVPPSPHSTVVGRRNSTRSVKNVRSRSSMLDTNTVLEVSARPLPASSATPTEKRLPLEQSSAPRPGLFKRFFTASRYNLNAATASSSERQLQEHTSETRDGTTVPATPLNKASKHAYKTSVDVRNKENQPPHVLQKKPSSFFRRRKKSVSTPIVPPLPLSLGAAFSNEIKFGEASPVSSLKAFMDPYLIGDQPQRSPQASSHPLHTFYTATQESIPPNPTTEDYSELARGISENLKRLTISHKETFFTDTSSAEDIETSGMSNVARSDITDISTDRPPVDSQSPSATPRASMNPSYSTVRPDVVTRSVSWHSPELIPRRKQSLSIHQATTISRPPLTRSGHCSISGSDISEYKSAPSTPATTQNTIDPIETISPRFHVSHPSICQSVSEMEKEKALQIYDNGEDEIDGRIAAAWLGEVGSDRERIRKVYLELYDFKSQNILAALRNLCSRLVLKAESQLIDRILDAFANRWCECNPKHGFRSVDVVHLICYAILLLNTDLHMADIGSKMTRNQFVKNALETIRAVVADDDGITGPPANQYLTGLSSSAANLESERLMVDRSTRTASSLSYRPVDRFVRADSKDIDNTASSGPLVDVAFSGSQAGWMFELEAVLKGFYSSIQREPLPLYGSESMGRLPVTISNNNLLSLSGLRRNPSVVSRAPSENTQNRTLASKWSSSRIRPRPRLGSTPGFGSSKNSLEDQSSAWSPSISSTWSKPSYSKTLASMSVDSFATSALGGNDFQSSIGFANALSQAIIREDQLGTHADDDPTNISSLKTTPLLEDESLELEGAPWAKEGIVKHKCHLDGTDKRSKDRNWNDCFAVIDKGWMRLFSFSTTAKSLRNKARNQKPGGVVGGGNWQDNAEEVWKFMLRHTIASSLPPPGYSKARPNVWALSLPTGAVHLFSVGTPDIVKEFVSTANFWSARLSKEPMIGGVSSMEYGWSDTVVYRPVTNVNLDGVRSSFASSDPARPSTQMSIRSSIDHTVNGRPRLPGDKIYISEWSPPQLSLFASQLLEVDQLKALQAYVSHVEEDLQRHNELRGPMMLTFSSRHPNYGRAMGNWEKKSAYLLREIVKFKGYIEALQGAQVSKERVYKTRTKERRHDEDVNDGDALALYESASTSMNSSGI